MPHPSVIFPVWYLKMELEWRGHRSSGLCLLAPMIAGYRYGHYNHMILWLDLEIYACFWCEVKKTTAGQAYVVLSALFLSHKHTPFSYESKFSRHHLFAMLLLFIPCSLMVVTFLIINRDEVLMWIQFLTYKRRF